ERALERPPQAQAFGVGRGHVARVARAAPAAEEEPGLARAGSLEDREGRAFAEREPGARAIERPRARGIERRERREAALDEGREGLDAAGDRAVGLTRGAEQRRVSRGGAPRGARLRDREPRPARAD